LQAISATGAKPVACDVDPDTLILNWRDAESRITPRSRAVMPVHYTGGVGDLDGIYAFASRHGLRVIEDAAHAFGTTLHGKRIGSFGDVACFSFDGIKNITAGEGGCVVTEDEVILQRVRDARLLGVEKDTEKRYRGQRSWEFDVTAQGWRYHMSNIMAAIGLEQLRRFDDMAAVRRTHARHYDDLLRGHPCLRPLVRDYETVVPHIYIVRITGLKDRKALQARLLEANIQTGIHYQPAHSLTLYRDPRAAPFPVTELACAEMLTLPLHCELTAADVAHVCESLRQQLQYV
jgi:dTDP-4-amino-4,6-dideoxygalactose transaminase